MHSKLLEKAFCKAKNTIHSDTPTHLARHLSDFIFEDSGEQFGEKSLRNYYKNCIEGARVDLKPFVVQALCHYLGYSGYDAYLVSLPKQITKRRQIGKQSVVSQIFTVIVVFFFFIGFLLSFRKAGKPICEVLHDWRATIEFQFCRMERLVRYLQGEAA